MCKGFVVTLMPYSVGSCKLHNRKFHEKSSHRSEYFKTLGTNVDTAQLESVTKFMLTQNLLSCYHKPQGYQYFTKLNIWKLYHKLWNIFTHVLANYTCIGLLFSAKSFPTANLQIMAGKEAKTICAMYETKWFSNQQVHKCVLWYFQVRYLQVV